MQGLSNSFRTLVLLSLSICIVSIGGFLEPTLQFELALAPRNTQQWWGLVTHVFVHRDWAHLASNLPPLIVFLVLIGLRNARYLVLCLVLSIIISAAILWLIGRPGMHIGASGLVFALFGVIVGNALFYRALFDILIAGVVFALYGGLLFGILPSDPHISWEGHLAGLIGGSGELDTRSTRCYQQSI